MTQPADSNQLHRRSDVDVGIYAIHHTLGYRPNQAAPGNHTHDGVSSKPIGLDNYYTKVQADALFGLAETLEELKTLFWMEL